MKYLSLTIIAILIALFAWSSAVELKELNRALNQLSKSVRETEQLANKRALESSSESSEASSSGSTETSSSGSSTSASSETSESSQPSSESSDASTSSDSEQVKAVTLFYDNSDCSKKPISGAITDIGCDFVTDKCLTTGQDGLWKQIRCLNAEERSEALDGMAALNRFSDQKCDNQTGTTFLRQEECVTINGAAYFKLSCEDGNMDICTDDKCEDCSPKKFSDGECTEDGVAGLRVQCDLSFGDGETSGGSGDGSGDGNESGDDLDESVNEEDTNGSTSILNHATVTLCFGVLMLISILASLL